jgi:hypothetical protein
MGKGVIKTTGMPQVSPIQPGLSLSLPPAFYSMGTIQDINNPQLPPIPFIQAFGTQLGLGLNLKVNYETITINGITIANGVKLVNRGEIVSLNTNNDGGTLMDRASQAVIPFYQPYANEMGLVAAVQGGANGTMVNFDVVTDTRSGTPVAVALVIV